MGKAMLSKSLTQFLGGAVFPPCSLAVLQLEPCPCGRSLQTCASAGDTQALKGRSGSVSSGGHCSFPSVLVLTGFRLHPPRISGRDLILNAIVKKKKCNCAPPTILLGLFLCPCTWGIFFGVIQHFAVNGCSAASCNFSIISGEVECMSFYSAILYEFFIGL